MSDFENDFEQEFRVRHQFEQEEQAREKFASKTAKDIGEIRTLTRQLSEKIDGVAARPMPTVPAPVVQHIHHEKPSPKEWTLSVTSREGGLMRTVVALADGTKAVEFTISRTPDGYPKTIQASSIV